MKKQIQKQNKMKKIIIIFIAILSISSVYGQDKFFSDEQDRIEKHLPQIDFFVKSADSILNLEDCKAKHIIELIEKDASIKDLERQMNITNTAYEKAILYINSADSLLDLCLIQTDIISDKYEFLTNNLISMAKSEDITIKEYANVQREHATLDRLINTLNENTISKLDKAISSFNDLHKRDENSGKDWQDLYKMLEKLGFGIE